MARRFPLVAAGVAATALLALLLSVPYSFGVGTTTYSIAEYLWVSWTTNPDMEHGFIVLPAMAFFIYQKRKQLFDCPPAGHSLLGLFTLAVGVLFFWAGSQADVTTIGLVSMMIILVGLVWFLLGWNALLILLFPIGFFIFAIPIPGIDTMIAFPLRMMMSHASVFVLNGLGIPTILEGTGIFSAPEPMLGIPAGKRFSVDVADPCSGIRSLYALMMVSALYGNFALTTGWKKGLLFLSSIPLAVAGNLVRILILTLGTIVFGAEFAIGKDALDDPSWFHMAAGFAVFGVAISGMLGIAWLLNNAGKVPQQSKSLIQLAREASASHASPPSPKATLSSNQPPKSREVITDEY